MRGLRYIIRIVLALFLISPVVLSCNPSPDNPTPAEGLILSSDNQTVNYDATLTSLTIKAKLDWTLSVTSGREWITPSVSGGGAGNTTVEFALTENGTETARKGTITLNAKGESKPYTFTITQDPENILKGVNKWIFEELGGWYYWNDAVKSATAPSNSLDYDAFLKATIEALPWSSVQDRSNGENPATIDGQWNDYGTSRTHIYSYIEKLPAGTRAGEGSEVTFGFDIEPFRVSRTTGQLYLMVKWVQPDGPADKAGLKRGMWITKFDGSDISDDGGENSSWSRFFYRLYYLRGGTSMTLVDDKEGTYSLQAVEMKVSPIIHSEVITTDGGKKVAYLVYSEFERGDNIGSDRNPKYEFEDELNKVFGEFKAAGATELVLDLRYNPGGYVNTCRLLAGLAANVDRSKVFAKMLRNSSIKEPWKAVYGSDIDNPEVVSFTNETNSLKLGKIYVLATRATASASEMVISSVRGVLGDGAVVHIGERTNGKNVGMDLIETVIGGSSYKMWPITFKILNAKDFTNYTNGFVPDLYKDEFWDITNQLGSGKINELGSKNERLLKAALTLIDGGTVGPDSQQSTRADGIARQPVTSPVALRRGGAKYIPDIQERHE